MTIELPWRSISGSATPMASTRLRMISMAWSSVPDFTLFLGWSTSEAPRWRSRPWWGVLPDAMVAPSRAKAMTMMPMRDAQRLRFTVSAWLCRSRSGARRSRPCARWRRRRSWSWRYHRRRACGRQRRRGRGRRRLPVRRCRLVGHALAHRGVDVVEGLARLELLELLGEAAADGG